MKDFITLAQGSGGKEMADLIQSFHFSNRSGWNHVDDDAATFPISKDERLVFTTDSFTVDPLFFPGGDIGHLAMCGTINDLVVMGADPLGISLGFVIEEGLAIKDLNRIVRSIDSISKEYKIPIVTGDTKVIERGKIDKMIINTSGVGRVKNADLLTKPISIGDKIILSGGLGEHAVALLSKRFAYETTVVTDSKPLIREIQAVKQYLKIAKDPTRGGIAATLNEICEKHQIGMILDEENIPIKSEVNNVVEMLGINVYDLACEGRFISIVSPDDADKVANHLKRFNKDAAIIGEIIKDDKVIVQSILGKRILPAPMGRIVPRIC